MWGSKAYSSDLKVIQFLKIVPNETEARMTKYLFLGIREREHLVTLDVFIGFVCFPEGAVQQQTSA